MTDAPPFEHATEAEEDDDFLDDLSRVLMADAQKMMENHQISCRPHTHEKNPRP